jgi:hypothetical protein
MQKQQSSDAATASKDLGSATAVTGSPPSPAPIPLPSDPPSSNSLPLILSGVGLLAVIGLIAIVWSQTGAEGDHTDQARPRVRKPKWEVVTADDQVCDTFVQKRNGGDPGGNNLLGPAPGVPAGAVSESEADRLQTEHFLRSDLTIVEIRRTQVPNRYCFVTQGNVAAPRLEVVHNNETCPEQRTMSNPDLYVEVRDGKIHGVRATLHRD